LETRKEHTLIVTPKSIITQWKTEIAKFAPNIKVMLFDGPGRQDKLSPTLML
jgi:SNF2 family DNA or RNA helicase